MKRLVTIGAIICVSFALGFSWYVWDSFVSKSPSDNSTEIIFEVKQGKSFFAVAKELSDKNLIKDATLFSWFARLQGNTNVKVGEYGLKMNMLPAEVLNIITSGKSIGRSITIPEGLNIFELAELFSDEGLGSKEEFLKLVHDPDFVQSLIGERQISLEGYLFPETYSATKFTDMKSFISQMVKKFLQVYQDIEPKVQQMRWTRHQAVTLASIVEKETGAPEERPIISAVFHNRLQKGMMLQTDPTVLYAKNLKTGKLNINITRNDLKDPHPYNTYTNRGLPPGPIANPSREALWSVVKPEKSDAFYFVSKNDGTHVFSKTYEEHAKAVRKLQMDPKARQGKSWRDLKKKQQK